MRLLIAMLAASCSAPAFAQDAMCSDHAAVVANLEDNWQETLQSSGLLPNGNTMQLFASPQTGTWTILVVRPDGLACGVSAGVDFTDIPYGFDS